MVQSDLLNLVGNTKNRETFCLKQDFNTNYFFSSQMHKSWCHYRLSRLKHDFLKLSIKISFETIFESNFFFSWWKSVPLSSYFNSRFALSAYRSKKKKKLKKLQYISHFIKIPILSKKKVSFLFSSIKSLLLTISRIWIIKIAEKTVLPSYSGLIFGINYMRRVIHNPVSRFSSKIKLD